LRRAGRAARAQRLLWWEQSGAASGTTHDHLQVPLDWREPPSFWAVDGARANARPPGKALSLVRTHSAGATPGESDPREKAPGSVALREAARVA